MFIAVERLHGEIYFFLQKQLFMSHAVGEIIRARKIDLTGPSQTSPALQ